MAAKAAEEAAAQLENGHAPEDTEATEMKELSSSDKLNVISEKQELTNGNSEVATSV